MPGAPGTARPRRVQAGVVARDLASALAVRHVLGAEDALDVAGTATTVGALLHTTGPLESVALEVPPADDLDVMLVAGCLQATGAAVVCFVAGPFGPGTDGPALPQRAELVAAGIPLVPLADLARELLMAALLPLPGSPAWPAARQR